MSELTAAKLVEKLASNDAITSQLAHGAASIVGDSEVTGDMDLPVLVIAYTGAKSMLVPHYCENWNIYCIDRDYGYFRIHKILREVRDYLNGSSLDIPDCFEVEWISNAQDGISRTFRSEQGASLYRIYFGG